jgi:hypothetical protein
LFCSNFTKELLEGKSTSYESGFSAELDTIIINEFNGAMRLKFTDFLLFILNLK